MHQDSRYGAQRRCPPPMRREPSCQENFEECQTEHNLACQKKLLLIDITSTANLAPVNELKVGRKIAEKRSLGFLGAKASATDRVSAGHWAKTLPILEWRARFPLNSVNCVDGN